MGAGITSPGGGFTAEMASQMCSTIQKKSHMSLAPPRGAARSCRKMGRKSRRKSLVPRSPGSPRRGPCTFCAKCIHARFLSTRLYGKGCSSDSRRSDRPAPSREFVRLDVRGRRGDRRDELVDVGRRTYGPARNRRSRGGRSGGPPDRGCRTARPPARAESVVRCGGCLERRGRPAVCGGTRPGRGAAAGAFVRESVFRLPTSSAPEGRRRRHRRVGTTSGSTSGPVGGRAGFAVGTRSARRRRPADNLSPPRRSRQLVLPQTRGDRQGGAAAVVALLLTALLLDEEAGGRSCRGEQVRRQARRGSAGR